VSSTDRLMSLFLDWDHLVGSSPSQLSTTLCSKLHDANDAMFCRTYAIPSSTLRPPPLSQRGFQRNLYVSTKSPFKNRRNWEDSIQRNGMSLFNPLRFGFGVGYYLFLSLTWPLTSIGYGYDSGSLPFFDKSLRQGPSHRS
jgi:hypothetical protein